MAAYSGVVAEQESAAQSAADYAARKQGEVDDAQAAELPASVSISDMVNGAPLPRVLADIRHPSPANPPAVWLMYQNRASKDNEQTSTVIKRQTRQSICCRVTITHAVIASPAAVYSHRSG